MSQMLYDHQGRAVSLGEKLGTGGEGDVFAVQSSDSSVAKVYHKKVSDQKNSKLHEMVRLADSELTRVAAWPTGLLRRAGSNDVVGILMPRVAGFKESHTLYSPAQRNVVFPKADWQFLIHTSMNCAAAFDTIHSKGHVVGDVNQSNVMVSDQATVCLIDCDSFQIRSNGKLFSCDVGVAQFTPPELQGKSFKSVERTANHDRFGIAVLIFHLLFMGRHPFAGRFGGKGEMPLERAIKEFRFAYSVNAAAREMAPPPHTLPLSALSKDLAALFERAFSPTSSQPNSRPTASEWAKSLLTFRNSLKECSVPGHKAFRDAICCPWCDLSKNGANFFIAVGNLRGIEDILHGGQSLDDVWKQCDAIQIVPTTWAESKSSRSFVPSPLPAGVVAKLPPTSIQSCPIPTPAKLSLARDTYQKIVEWHAIAGALCACFGLTASALVLVAGLSIFFVFGIFWLALENSRMDQEKVMNDELIAEFERKNQQLQEGFLAKTRLQKEVLNARLVELNHRTELVREATLALTIAEANRRSTAEQYRNSQLSLRAKIFELRRELDGLPSAYQIDLEGLQSNSEKSQRDQYLNSVFISNHKIAGVGASRKAILSSYNIETAADITKARLAGVPGFGEVFTDRLMEWRFQMERGFRFNPRSGVPQSQVSAVQVRYKQLREGIELGVRSKMRELTTLTTNAERHLAEINRAIRTLADAVGQAEADLSLLRD